MTNDNEKTVRTSGKRSVKSARLPSAVAAG